MILRTKSGDIVITAASMPSSILLDYLGVKLGAAGVQSNLGTRFAITDDVELITCVPFRLTADIESGQGLPWTLSTFDLDRYGERIDPLGWDFKRFVENPVVEWSHRYDIPAIGKIENLSIDNEGLHGVVYFNDKSFDPFAWSIEQRIKAGSIRAGSVGFRVMEIEIPAASESKDGTSLIFRKQELLEFSICNVPANPFALAKSIKTNDTETTQELNCPRTFGSTYWGGLINNL
jgi:HK97 family phage prohead protease